MREAVAACEIGEICRFKAVSTNFADGRSSRRVGPIVAVVGPIVAVVARCDDRLCR